MSTSNQDKPSDTPGAEVLYGVAGWSYADWEGLVYPGGADGATKMLTVAAACDLLEINTSFYHTPKPAVTAAWARRLERAALPDRIVIKVHRAFTHEPDYAAADVRLLREALAPLDESGVVDRDGVEQPRLLGLLLQFPYTFRLTPENSQRIERLGEDLADWTRIIELRHASWARPVAYDWLAKRGFCLANIDLPAGSARAGRSSEPGKRGQTPFSQPPQVVAAGPERGGQSPFSKRPEKGDSPQPPEKGDSPHAFPPQVVATGPVGYLRLHGRNAQAWFDRKAPVDQKYNYLYSPEELSDLADRIRDLAGRARTVAVVGNNHYRGKALVTVLNLARLVQGRRARLPAALIEEYPQLREFADPADPVRVPPPGRGGRTDGPPRPRGSPKRPPKDDGGQLRLFQ